MKQFIKYLGASHINGKNIAAYRAGDAVVLQAEEVASDSVLGSRRFSSIESAEAWFDNVDGIEIGRLFNAINLLISGDAP